jgi:type II secretory pathway pseudopilin PulG
MGNHKLAGFTIIETVLFLGISSFLIVALIAGTGNSVNIQRYNDAVQTFKSTLQQQYADVSSVQNSRNNNWSCGSTVSPVTTGSASDNRGQSKCILMGKYVRLEDDKISIYRVIGYQQATATLSNDILSLKNNYRMNVLNDDVEKTTLEWGTRISYPKTQGGSANAAYPKPQNPRKLALLIVRSPDSGQIYTFSVSDADVPDDANINPTNIASMIVAGGFSPGEAQGARFICINSDGLLINNSTAILLNAFASSASAVETQTNDLMQSSVLGFKC